TEPAGVERDPGQPAGCAGRRRVPLLRALVFEVDDDEPEPSRAEEGDPDGCFDLRERGVPELAGPGFDTDRGRARDNRHRRAGRSSACHNHGARTRHRTRGDRPCQPGHTALHGRAESPPAGRPGDLPEGDGPGRAAPAADLVNSEGGTGAVAFAVTFPAGLAGHCPSRKVREMWGQRPAARTIWSSWRRLLSHPRTFRRVCAGPSSSVHGWCGAPGVPIRVWHSPTLPSWSSPASWTTTASAGPTSLSRFPSHGRTARSLRCLRRTSTCPSM